MFLLYSTILYDITFYIISYYAILYHRNASMQRLEEKDQGSRDLGAHAKSLTESKAVRSPGHVLGEPTALALRARSPNALERSAAHVRLSSVDNAREYNVK